MTIKITRIRAGVYVGQGGPEGEQGDYFVIRKIAKPGFQWCLYIRLSEEQCDAHVQDNSSMVSRLADTYYVDCKTKARAIDNLAIVMRYETAKQMRKAVK